jgi:hypothetical protein
MADLQPTIEKMLDEVLKPHFEQIRAEMSKRLAEQMEEMGAAAPAAAAVTGDASAPTPPPC